LGKKASQSLKMHAFNCLTYEALRSYISWFLLQNVTDNG